MMMVVFADKSLVSFIDLHSMQTSQQSQRFYHQPEPIQPFCLTGSHFQTINNGGSYPDNRSRHPTTSAATVESFNEKLFTLESSPATDFPIYNSSMSSYSFSPQGSAQSCLSNAHNSSSDNTYGSPISNGVEQFLKEVENELLGPGSDFEDGSISSSFDSANRHSKMFQLRISNMDLKQLLSACARAIDDDAMDDAKGFMEALRSKVSVSGDPIQRLGAYMLEGLQARMISSGSVIYEKLECVAPTGKELMSYMSVLYEICPYYKFAYKSANVIIKEAVQYESHVHVIDFLIAQGSQWMELIEDLAKRPGGPPMLRVTGVDDWDSKYARGGGLQMVGERLATFAASCGVPFEFHAAAISGSEVQRGNLEVQPGYALAVNFPYMLHHMPDESVSTINHRDRLIRLVKSLSPKVVTLLEQESNTNTSSFSRRFEEAVEYYTAMFESIDAGVPLRDPGQRIRAEEHCVAKDMVNIVACEDKERVERHEPLDKWRFRMTSAGLMPCPMSSSAAAVIQEMLRKNKYSENYWVGEKEGALVLGWKGRPMVTSSAWR